MPANEVNDIRRYLDKAGCPVCARLKKCQSDLLGAGAIVNAPHLCNVHAWALAKSAPAFSAAGALLSALRQSADKGSCPFCSRLSEMEAQFIAALAELLVQAKDRQWMQHYGRLCLAHARRLEELVDEEGKKTIREIVRRIREELDGELAMLLRNPGTAHSLGGGVLGRAAEFLVSQRGLGSLNGGREKQK